MDKKYDKYSCLDPKPLIKKLLELAYNGLKNMFDEDSKLFCFKIRKVQNGLKKEGLSYRYTIISSIGLNKFKSIYGESPINIEDVLNNLISLSDKINNIGDFGLLIWLCALVAPEWVIRIFEKHELKNILNRFDDARQGKTTELSWVLAGLSHLSLISNRYLNEFEKLANQTYEMIKGNYGKNGIFWHMNNSSIVGILRGRIGCFADQIYPIYALSVFSKAYKNHESLKIALECAKKICELQGPLGQWWWHYDSITGNVIGKYPVFSVHQDGMAPMSLFSIGHISGLNLKSNIYKGLEWITGMNELGMNLIDESRNLIWRSLYKGKYRSYCEQIMSFLRIKQDKNQINNLKVLHECRPYHLGWLLYAFAERNR